MSNGEKGVNWSAIAIAIVVIAIISFGAYKACSSDKTPSAADTTAVDTTIRAVPATVDTVPDSLKARADTAQR